MRFDYFFDTSEKSLTSFFSENVLSGTRICIYLASACLICFWPFKTTFAHISVKGTPLTYPVVFIFSLIWVSHFLLGCRKGETLDKEIILKYKHKKLLTHEQTLGLFAYCIPGFILHTLFVHLILLPVYIAAAFVSGISYGLFFASLMVLFSSSLVAGMIGFLCYLGFGLWRLAGFVCSRLLFAGFFFLSGLIIPAASPVYILFQIFDRGEFEASLFLDIQLHLTIAAFVLAGLVIFCSLLLKKEKPKETG